MLDGRSLVYSGSKMGLISGSEIIPRGGFLESPSRDCYGIEIHLPKNHE